MIDWEAAHRRLAQLGTALERGGRRNARDMRDVLRERARLLARPPGAASAAAGGQVEFLEFAVADERYGIETAHVREVASVTAPTPVPGVPAFIAGVVTVRGQILSVLDLGQLFGLPDPGGAPPGRLVVLDGPDMPMGILAAAIRGVRAVPPSEIEAALPTLGRGGAAYLRGIDRTGVAILDASALLAAQDLIVGAAAGP
jgi:purine-binding chemotaxis protein CheW